MHAPSFSHERPTTCWRCGRTLPVGEKCEWLAVAAASATSHNTEAHGAALLASSVTSQRSGSWDTSPDPGRLSMGFWMPMWLVAFVYGLWTGYMHYAFWSTRLPPDVEISANIRSEGAPCVLKKGPIASHIEVSSPGLACDSRPRFGDGIWEQMGGERWEQITWYEPDEMCADVYENSERRTRMAPTMCLPHDPNTPYLGPGVSGCEPREETACR